MKELLSAASNVFFREGDDGEMKRHHEIVLVLSEPTFKVDAAGQIVRERMTETMRFVASDAALLALAADFLERAKPEEK